MQPASLEPFLKIFKRSRLEQNNNADVNAYALLFTRKFLVQSASLEPFLKRLVVKRLYLHSYPLYYNLGPHWENRSGHI